ncbi:TrkA family potassium uptake protein [cf. Phormidesmis sp. LEGE 11477]|uniref:potassium channel family protein n=1 Tax=cf. Phormidesmis sp. LEGE 11477 TaxID=1828680 RepID=UPI00187DDC0A|nr:NAD-binding protein [cf. Phormidesmis sp. LEGE 11477]MBE9059708.1 NAD-binding protein [cf. Phormidesmis sp. LEGE 11477]
MRIILIGTDKLTYFLGRRFASKGYFLTIITPEEENAIALSRKLKATVLTGNGSDPAMLQEAGAYQADVLLALTPKDQDNLIACQIAQDRYGVPKTVALVNDPENREIFEELGVSVAFSATEVLGSMIEQQTASADIRNLVPVTDSGVTITEVVLAENSPAVGSAIKDLKLQGAVVACVVRRGRVLLAQRRSYLHAGDRVLLISESDRYGQAQKALTGEGA